MGYFIDWLCETHEVKRKLQFDGGMENGLIKDMQTAMRSVHDDNASGENSVFVGRSVNNQRIERWWGVLRTCNADFWIQIFSDLEERDIYCRNNPVHKELLVTKHRDL